ncbi:nucleotide sugar dehydrogenase [Lactococcus garvieae]|uniref:nucleotide sugar dehydrogenase n=1 Tax=Lactococcus garvieae TaxID=1363 RepID=UPI003853B336
MEFKNSCTSKEVIENKIKNKTAMVGVIGLGYVGLPIAMELAKSGINVVGIDISEYKISQLNQGKSYILDVPELTLKQAIETNHFRATPDFQAISDLDAVIISVPTPLNRNQEPDTAHLKNVADNILTHMVPGKPLLISLESTSYPGTTRELFADFFDNHGKKQNEDYFLCFSPERVDPGNKEFQSNNTPKVIGGLTSESSELGELLYKLVTNQVFRVKTLETAEMSKLLENTFRSVNIAFINEMSLMCERMGIDIWETIDAASTKPFGFMPFYPGPGVGGHCIPLDPMYLYWKGKEHKFFNRFIETSQEINMNMPYSVVDKIQQALNNQEKALNGGKILLVGVAYKSNINDVRESPSLDIYEILKQWQTNIDVLDPFVKSFRDKNGNVVNVLSPEVCDFSDYDCAVVLVNHSNMDYDSLLEKSLAIVDMCNVYKSKTSNKINRIGGGGKLS